MTPLIITAESICITPRPQYAGGIWKRSFHSEKTSNVLRPHYANGNQRPFWICVPGKLRLGNIMRVLTSSFSKCSPSTLKGKVSFSNSSSLKSIFQKFCFRDEVVCRVGLTGAIKLRFQEFFRQNKM